MPPESGFFVVVPTGVTAVNRAVVGFNKRREFAISNGSVAFRVSAAVEHPLATRAFRSQFDHVHTIAMNEAGDVLGSDYLDTEPYHRMIKWPAGSDMAVTPPFPTYNEAADMNDAGTVLTSDWAGSLASRRVAFILWTANGRDTTSSVSVTYERATILPFAINNSRDILADISYEPDVFVPAVMRPAALGSCPFTNGHAAARSRALNDSGAYVYERGGEHCLVQPGLAPVIVKLRVARHGLNNNGWLIGSDSAGRAAVSVRGGGPIAWDRMFGSASDLDGWTITGFAGINDLNEILAVGTKGADTQFVILVPRAN